MARGVAYFVFLIPIIFSIALGTGVMAQIVQEPDRGLDMWRFNSSEIISDSEKSIQIIGVKKQYGTSEPVSIQVRVADKSFDCGDLYITIYDAKSKLAITQSGYFDQCFVNNDLIIPIDEEFSELVDSPGNYEIMAQISDKSQKETLSTYVKFSVK